MLGSTRSTVVLYQTVGRLHSITLPLIPPDLVPGRAGVQQGVLRHAGVELPGGVPLLQALLLLVLLQQSLKFSLCVCSSILALGETQVAFFILSLKLSNPVLCKRDN